MTRIFLALIWMAACPAVLAAEPAASWAGVWRGTVGTQTVSVCLRSFESSYYYEKRLFGIRLEEADSDKALPKTWIEGFSGASTGTWTLTTLKAQQLEGRWISPDGRKTLPIRLKLAKPASEHAGSCDYPPEQPGTRRFQGSAFVAFNATRFQAAPRQSKAASFEGKPYAEVRQGGSTGFELPENSPQALALNAFGTQWQQEQMGQAYGCELNLRLREGGKVGALDWSRSLTPILWTNRWLTLQDNLADTDCGGAHSISETVFHVFDLTSGQRVDVRRWFKLTPDAWGIKSDDPRLLALLHKAEAALMGHEGCDPGTFFHPYPAPRGMGFWLTHGHAGRACDDTVVLPYEKVMPYLSRSGREAVRSLNASPNTGP